MGYYYGSGSSSQYPSVFDAFTLSPLPYPVLLLLTVVMLPLGISWIFSYEEMAEAAEKQMSWVLLLIPVLLLLTIRCLSSFDGGAGSFFSGYGTNRRSRGGYFDLPQEGSSPWGVAALVVLLLVLISFQPESWFP